MFDHKGMIRHDEEVAATGRSRRPLTRREGDSGSLHDDHARVICSSDDPVVGDWLELEAEVRSFVRLLRVG